MSKILIVGGYGIGNIGDEAILAGILEQAVDKKDDVTVIAHNPQDIKKFHNKKGVKIASLAFIKSLLTSNVIFVGGGTIFRSNMRLRAQLMPLVIIATKLFGTKVKFYSLGIDKNTSPLAKKLVTFAMNRADFVSVRDKKSLAVLKSWGVKKKIHMVKDPAIDLKPKKWSSKELSKLGINTRKKTIGVSLRYLSKEQSLELLKPLAEIINGLSNKDLQFVYLSFSRHPTSKFEDDLHVGKALKKLLNKDVDYLIVNKVLGPKELKGLVSSMKAFIGMRLHSMIFAVSTNTPLIGLSYSQKCTAFLEENNKKVYDMNKFDKKSIKKDLLSFLK